MQTSLKAIFKFTAIVNAADADGIAQDYAIHFEATSAAAMPAAVESEWENLFGDGSWEARGAEVTGYMVGWVQIYSVAMSQNDDGSDAARQAFEAALPAGELPEFTLKIGRRHTGVYPTAAAARDAYKRLRDESMEGASTWPAGVITSGKTKIYLSYNGRAWADRQSTQPIEL